MVEGRGIRRLWDEDQSGVFEKVEGLSWLGEREIEGGGEGGEEERRVTEEFERSGGQSVWTRGSDPWKSRECCVNFVSRDGREGWERVE
jgi:hypothetical protein